MSIPPSGVEREKRFDWINGFMTASLNATISSLNRGLGNLSFQDLNRDYVAQVLDGLGSVSNKPCVSVGSDDLDYLFHLEGELWGPDSDEYAPFFQQGASGAPILLQTCLLVHAFFLIERWLNTFASGAVRGTRKRRRLREDLFGKTQGLFTVRHPDCLSVLGPPYSLLASTTQVSEVGGGGQWTGLGSKVVPLRLQVFYGHVSGYTHFVPLLEAAFKKSRQELAVHLFGPLDPHRQNRRRTRNELNKLQGERATWYDVVWRYSESIRYHPIWPSRTCLRQPFYWNRSIRWCTSLLISGILCLVSQTVPKSRIRVSWTRAIGVNPLLASVFSNTRDAIV